MNVIRVYGGLGNQLFQYAFGKAMEARGIKVGFETSWYRKPVNFDRPYCLDKFNTVVNPSGFVNKRSVDETRIGYLYDIMFLDIKDCNFLGYWQHPPYYESIFPQLKNEFQVKEKYHNSAYLDLRERIEGQESVALHVRRGDYIRINGHHLLTLEYYRRALEMMNPTGEVFIFSDDIPWCKQHLQDAVYVDLNEYLSFDLMRLCKHDICANSTYSWWAATLNDNPDKVVIIPNQWRIDKKAQSVVSREFLSPPGWKKISLEDDWNGK